MTVGHSYESASVLRNWRFWLMGLLATIAFGVAASLTWSTLTSSPIVGCAGDGFFQCDHVLKTKWATVFGVPVSAMALGVYGALLGGLGTLALTRERKARAKVWRMVTFCAYLAGLAAIWFAILQFFIIGKLCSPCLIVHGCGLGIAALTLMQPHVSRRWQARLVGAALASWALLISAQWLTPPPKSYQIENYTVPASEPASDVFEAPGTEKGDDVSTSSPVTNKSRRESIEARLARTMIQLVPSLLAVSPVAAPQQESTPKQESSQPPQKPSESQEARESSEQDSTNKPSDDERRLVRVALGSTGQATSLDPRHWPIIGSPDAKRICVEMFDYTCKHCRKSQQAIRGAMQEQGNELAMIVLAVPMNTQCNPSVQATQAEQANACEIARLAISVWRLKPAEFRQFHEWILEGERPPAMSEIQKRAEELVGKKELDDELKAGQADKFIARHVELYQRAGAGPVPKFLFPASSLTGEITSPQDFLAAVNRAMR